MSRSVRTILAGLTATAAVTASTLAVASPAHAATHYNIMNYKSALCMSVGGGGSLANGAHIIQWGCPFPGDSTPERFWHWSGSRIINDKSGKCLSVADGGSTANGAAIIQWTCNGGLEQSWRSSGGYLINGKSGKVVSVEGGGSVDVGARLVQWSMTGGQEQGWEFKAIYIDG
ncbi:RICIN domain-containing protein [Micromonospora sp. KC723]|uniref:RICIN domain-containing protein n=1 Tax=Micromonospora sp. KC723 TaxID=2530381 RepID=UPI0014050BFB|nr:RICIN domain-containing protein [Micromonospora sp. KC723]